MNFKCISILYHVNTILTSIRNSLDEKMHKLLHIHVWRQNCIRSFISMQLFYYSASHATVDTTCYSSRIVELFCQTISNILLNSILSKATQRHVYWVCLTQMKLIIDYLFVHQWADYGIQLALYNLFISY